MWFGLLHAHRAGCRCPQCLSACDHAVSAGQQLYAVLELEWHGLRSCQHHADLIGADIDEALPPRARENLVHLRQRNPELLAQLLADILDQ